MFYFIKNIKMLVDAVLVLRTVAQSRQCYLMLLKLDLWESFLINPFSLNLLKAVLALSQQILIM